MKNKEGLLKIAVASILIALGIVLPFITLNNQALGSIFALMHIPVFLSGLILGWQYGLIVGLITPILRHFIVGMPPIHVALSMMFELGSYGAVIALVYQFLPKKKSYMVEVSLLISMLVGRLVWGLAASILYKAFGVNFSFEIFVSAGFVKAFPGILIHLLLVPNIFYRLKNTDVLNYVGLKECPSEETNYTE